MEFIFLLVWYTLFSSYTSFVTYIRMKNSLPLCNVIIVTTISPHIKIIEESYNYFVYMKWIECNEVYLYTHICSHIYKYRYIQTIMYTYPQTYINNTYIKTCVCMWCNNSTYIISIETYYSRQDVWFYRLDILNNNSYILSNPSVVQLMW